MKKCKKCWIINENPLLKLCKKHYFEEQLNNQKQKKIYEIKKTSLKISQKPLNKISKTNTNTIAKFTKKIKDEIKERDKVCIISWEKIEEYHHAFYWPHYANYTKNRNNSNQWVWLSAEIHRIIHHPSPEETELAKKYRFQCMEYLIKLK